MMTEAGSDQKHFKSQEKVRKALGTKEKMELNLAILV